MPGPKTPHTPNFHETVAAMKERNGLGFINDLKVAACDNSVLSHIIPSASCEASRDAVKHRGDKGK